MSRPVKPRNICPCPLPERRFVAGHREVELAADELEAIRWVDLENLDQSGAGERLNVSRGTVQRLVKSAHLKLAFALVSGYSIRIAGTPGDGGCPKSRSCRFCRRRIMSSTNNGGHIMKIAVTCENHEVFQHFGHTPEFAVFEIVDGRINGMKTEPTGEAGHGALAGFLAERGIEILICGGIGAGAQAALAEAGIEVVGGASGDVIEAVGNYLAGTLETAGDFQCHRHDGEAAHSCGSHGCGKH